jgi:hypothetical protein
MNDAQEAKNEAPWPELLIGAMTSEINTLSNQLDLADKYIFTIYAGNLCITDVAEIV